MTRCALITGSSGGIGQHLCEEFANAGWTVIGTDLAERKNAFVSHFIAADIGTFARDPRELEAFAKKVRSLCRNTPLQCIINNAATQHIGHLPNLAHDDIVSTFDTNVIAPMLIAKALHADLDNASGVIVNIGSVHAQATKSGFAAYAASKAALHGLTRALAVDLGPNIRVVTLAPAATETDMLRAGFEGRDVSFEELKAAHPLQRIASPGEIARLALFLSSAEASFVTGATFYADGGVLSRLYDPA